jgi:acyl-CoA synthetase (AMP-forming)/AMP-acid ligase II
MTSDEIRLIEAHLRAHPSVEDVCVMVLPVRGSGKGVKAFVAVRADESVSVEELCRCCQQGEAELLDASSIVIVPELPKTSTGSISRRQLLDMCNAHCGMVATAFWAVRVFLGHHANDFNP